MGANDRYLRIANWDRYQAFKDGRPMQYFIVQAISNPKKGRIGILDDPAFLKLVDDPGCPVFRLMAYAAQTGNKIPNDPVFLKAKLFTERPIELDRMIAAGFLEPHPDSPLLQAIPESVQPRTNPYESPPRREEKRQETPTSETFGSDLQQVYDYWRERLGKKDARYAKRIAPNRRTKIAARLREFTVDELKRAIDGVALDPWPDRPRHNDLTIVFRSEEQVEKFLDIARNNLRLPCPHCGLEFRTQRRLNDHLHVVHEAA